MLFSDSLYSEKVLFTIKTTSLISIILLFIRNILRIYNWYSIKAIIDPVELRACIVSIITSIIFFILFLRPHKFILIGIIALYYSLEIAFHDANDMLCIPMYFIGVATFSIRGFFNQNRKLKLSLFILFYIIICVFPLRFGFNEFVSSLLLKIVNTFIFLVAVFFITENNGNKIRDYSQTEYILNIANYDKLNSRDAEMLELLLQKKAYKEIAAFENLKEGTVKNRMSIIFSILGTGDKVGFLNRYGKYKIVYESSDNSIE